MELKYLQTFQTIIEEGSFTKAAEKLNYTQSTITFQMGQLEQELSAKLFERVGRRMMPTKAANNYALMSEMYYHPSTGCAALKMTWRNTEAL